MKTKYIIGSILLLSVIYLTSCRDLDDPEEFMYGKWKISSIDSFAQVVYPDATVNEYQIISDQGSFYFHQNGTCTIRNINRDTLLCGKEFNWVRTNTDTITINGHPSLFTQYSNNKIQFYIYPWAYDGVNVWYSVVLKR